MMPQKNSDTGFNKDKTNPENKTKNCVEPSIGLGKDTYFNNDKSSILSSWVKSSIKSLDYFDMPINFQIKNQDR